MGGEQEQGQKGEISSIGGSVGLEPRVQAGGWPGGRLESVAGEPRAARKPSPRYSESYREALTGFQQDQIFVLGSAWSIIGGRQTF